tara:strand:- start:666 stop:905 length:240 start_codon:yes stop_codon:yes gene_type:complete
MFNCSFCNGKSECQEWLLYSSLCSDCQKIQAHIKYYDVKTITNILDDIFKKRDMGIENKKIEVKKKLTYSDIVKEMPIV